VIVITVATLLLLIHRLNIVVMEESVIDLGLEFPLVVEIEFTQGAHRFAVMEGYSKENAII